MRGIRKRLSCYFYSWFSPLPAFQSIPFCFAFVKRGDRVKAVVPLLDDTVGNLVRPVLRFSSNVFSWTLYSNNSNGKLLCLLHIRDYTCSIVVIIRQTNKCFFENFFLQIFWDNTCEYFLRKWGRQNNFERNNIENFKPMK